MQSQYTCWKWRLLIGKDFGRLESDELILKQKLAQQNRHSTDSKRTLVNGKCVQLVRTGYFNRTYHQCAPIHCINLNFVIQYGKPHQCSTADTWFGVGREPNTISKDFSIIRLILLLLLQPSPQPLSLHRINRVCLRFKRPNIWCSLQIRLLCFCARKHFRIFKRRSMKWCGKCMELNLSLSLSRIGPKQTILASEWS